MEKSLDELRKVHAQFVFIHQRLTQTSQYFISEFEIAQDAIRTVTDMCNKMHDEILDLEHKELSKATDDINEQE